MNVYEEAHALLRAIKESEEFRQFDASRKKISENEQLDKMISDFHARQMETQAKQLMGEEVGQEELQQVQDLYRVVATDPLAAEYLQSEMRFQLMMQDVYKILGEVLMPPAGK